MRGSTKKKLELWAKKTWNENDTKQQKSFACFEHYLDALKESWNTIPDFKKFINDTLKKGLV